MFGPRRSPHRRQPESTGSSTPSSSPIPAFAVALILLSSPAKAASTATVDCSEGREYAESVAESIKRDAPNYPPKVVDLVVRALAAPSDTCPDWQALQAAINYSVRDIEDESVEFSTMTPDDQWRTVNTRGRAIAIVDYVLDLPEEQVDIWTADLTLAEDRNPDLDVQGLTDQFEAIVASAASVVPSSADPDLRIRALNSFLYRELGIEYDHAALNGKPTHHYIHEVVTKRKGVCGNLAGFYIAVAQRLGLPIYGVRVPSHLFARYVDPKNPKLIQQNIEPTAYGGYKSDAEYVQETDLSVDTLMRGYYLTTLPYRELVAELILGHAMSFYADEKRELVTAIEIAQRARGNMRGSPDALYASGRLYDGWGNNQTEPALKEAIYTRALFLKLKGQIAGWRAPPDGEPGL